MPVLKIKQDGVWKEISGIDEHTHDVATTTTNGFMSAEDKVKLDSLKLAPDVDDALSNSSTNPVQNKVVEAAISDLQTKVGDESVSDQIDNALVNFESGKTLTEHLTEEMMVLTSLQYGDTLPEPGVVGRIFFKKVTE